MSCEGGDDGDGFCEFVEAVFGVEGVMEDSEGLCEVVCACEEESTAVEDEVVVVGFFLVRVCEGIEEVLGLGEVFEVEGVKEGLDMFFEGRRSGGHEGLRGGGGVGGC